MFKLIKGGKKDEPKAMPEPVPTNNPDWRNQDESMFEFLARVDCMGNRQTSTISVIIAGLAAVILAVVPALEALDKFAS